jgi:ribosomal protein S18 acetylase RimI-like enzyme
VFLFKRRYRGATGQAWGAVYEGRWDGAVHPQASEVAWFAWVAPDQLDRMLADLVFCPDSREIFERLRRGHRDSEDHVAPRNARDLRCRDATSGDAAAIAATHVAAWRAAYEGLVPAEFLAGLDADRARDRWARWLGDGGTVVVVEAAGAVVGFCRYGPSRDADRGQSTGEVVAINVHPASWRQGLGRALLDAALSRLRAAGFAEATLWVLQGNERARRFYEALGGHADGAERIESHLTGSPLHEVRYRFPTAESTPRRR